MNNAHQFINFIRSHGYDPVPEITAGKWIRFGRKKAVSAMFYEDGMGGILHDWSTGSKYHWFADRNHESPDEWEKRQKEMDAIRRASQAKEELAHASVAKRAEKLFKEAPIASDEHGYLVKKQVSSHGLKQLGHELLVPVYSVMGEFQTIQFITDSTYTSGNNKRFFTGGKKKGGCHFIGEIVVGKPVYICEGYATAVSVYEDTQSLTIVAFDSGNLIHVATDLRAQMPDIEIMIAGDCDDAGVRAAEAAAKAVNGSTLFPSFGDNPNKYSDWNDYFTNWVNK
jgi:putative DNA primase/helicase